MASPQTRRAGRGVLAVLLGCCARLAVAHAGHGTPLENLAENAVRKNAAGAFFTATLSYNPFAEHRRGEMILQVAGADGSPATDAEVSGIIFPTADDTTSETLFFRRDTAAPEMQVVRPLIPGGIPHTMLVEIRNTQHMEELRFDNILSEKTTDTPATDGSQSGKKYPMIPAAVVIAFVFAAGFVLVRKL